MRSITVLLSILFAFVLGVFTNGQQVTPSPFQKPRLAQKESDVADLMQRKRQLAHDVFDAIVVKDFKGIGKDARALTAISQAAVWRVMLTPRYAQYTADFQEATEKMAVKAGEKNSDGTTLAFTQMTLACVRCHDYMREKRTVRLEGFSVEQTVAAGPEKSRMIK